MTPDFQVQESELNELREERDQARALAAEMQEWLGLALAALGVETVFDIPRVEAGADR